jgi:hypothetical protein
MVKKSLIGLAALAAVLSSGSASAAIYNYTMTNGDKLVIDSDTGKSTFTGATINASMTSSAFNTFTGGMYPSFTAVLSALDGTRLINGAWVTDNPLYSTTTHPQKLIMSGADINLWAWWGDPIIGGDYLTRIASYSVSPSVSVPEPGVAGLFAAAFGWLAFTRRRRRKLAVAAA